MLLIMEKRCSAVFVIPRISFIRSSHWGLVYVFFVIRMIYFIRNCHWGLVYVFVIPMISFIRNSHWGLVYVFVIDMISYLHMISFLWEKAKPLWMWCVWFLFWGQRRNSTKELLKPEVLTVSPPPHRMVEANSWELQGGHLRISVLLLENCHTAGNPFRTNSQLKHA